MCCNLSMYCGAFLSGTVLNPLELEIVQTLMMHYVIQLDIWTFLPKERNVQYDAEMQSAERMMIYMDYQSPNLLKDSVLYYIAGHIVRAILPKLECLKCKKELLLDPDDPNAL